MEEKKAKYLVYVFGDGYETKAPVFGMSGKRQWYLSRTHKELLYVKVVY